jgi:hypothetical protein
VNPTVCTLFEGDYHLGAAALINSLHRAGFAGTVVCGHRGPAPAWHNANPAPIRLLWVEITDPVHFTNYKPAFMEACWTTHTPDAELMFYADPDLVVKAPWSVLARWARDGIALCEDVNANFPQRHPYKLAWLDFLEARQLTPRRTSDRYYNAGFLGLPRAHRGFLATWQSILDLANTHLGSLDRLKHGGPHELFHSSDQDALNIALLLGDWPINSTGPEGMDFLPGGHLLSHAAGGIKPWRGKFIREALRGRPPGPAQKAFHDHLAGPLPVLPAALVKRRRLTLALAALLGRFYHRS